MLREKSNRAGQGKARFVREIASKIASNCVNRRDTSRCMYLDMARYCSVASPGRLHDMADRRSTEGDCRKCACAVAFPGHMMRCIGPSLPSNSTGRGLEVGESSATLNNDSGDKLIVKLKFDIKSALRFFFNLSCSVVNEVKQTKKQWGQRRFGNFHFQHESFFFA